VNPAKLIAVLAAVACRWNLLIASVTNAARSADVASRPISWRRFDSECAIQMLLACAEMLEYNLMAARRRK